jgi:hypothetical protein
VEGREAALKIIMDLEALEVYRYLSYYLLTRVG